jgi:transcription elongation factor S-II
MEINKVVNDNSNVDDNIIQDNVREEFIESINIYEDIIEEKTKIEKILKDSLKGSATDMFECPRCHKRKTIYCEVQTRSSDEPMTKFITCLECGCKWKKY